MCPDINTRKLLQKTFMHRCTENTFKSFAHRSSLHRFRIIYRSTIAVQLLLYTKLRMQHTMLVYLHLLISKGDRGYHEDRANRREGPGRIVEIRFYNYHELLHLDLKRP